MSLLTLRVSKRDERTLVYVLLSLDPNERVETSEIEHTLPDSFQAVLSRALTDVEQCLRVGSKARLEKVGSDLARDVFPDAVKTALLESKDSYLYLDLEDTLVSFPWECIRIGESFIGTKFKAGRHIRVIDEGRAYKSLSEKQRCAIIANPDGSLKDAAKEGDLLADQLKTLGDVDLLKTNVTVNEACEVIASKDVFHFAGHSTGTGLRFSDRDMTAGDIASLPSVPRMVFLNSCDSGSLNAWANVDHSVVRAFLQAGSRAVIAAASPVATEQAAETARRFYERFLQKETLGQSLTAASTHATDELAWARYVVFGHPEFKLTRDEAPSTKKISKRALLLASLAACAMLAVVGVFSFKILSQHTAGLTSEERVSEEACLKGESARCYTLGESLINKARYKESIKYLQKACDQGAGPACVALAASQFVMGDVATARSLIQTHCIDGEQSCREWADFFRDHKAYDLAMKIYEKRCNNNDRLSCPSAGALKVELGDLPGALEMNRKGCKLGFQLSCAQAGAILTKMGKADAAVKLLAGLCTPDESESACIYLGAALLEQGKTKRALVAFRMGCKESSVTPAIDCELAAAVLHQKGRKEALEFFRKGCDYGRASACEKMSSLLAEEKNPCGNLAPDDCYLLGYKFQKGGDLSRSEKIYRYLCENGTIAQCNDVGLIHRLRGDMPAAKRVFKDACAKKIGISCYNLGSILADEGRADEAVELFEQAKKIAIQGCDVNDGASCHFAGSLFQKLADPKGSEPFLVKACRLEDAMGCLNLGFLKNSRGDKEGAKADYKKSCDLGFNKGCRNLAILLNELGSKEAAKTVLTKACDRGDVPACDLLKSAGVAH